MSNSHSHAHKHDRGIFAFVRYLRFLRELWRSEVSSEVARAVAPKSDERVVDLGAGMGSATIEAARTGASIVAVDPLPFMRWMLRLRCLWSGRTRITVLDGAAESIPVAKGSVDALWTVNTIHHWTERDKAFRELARIVRPGGRVLLVDEDMGDPAHPWYKRWKDRKFHFDEVDPEIVAAGLLSAGFASARGSRTTFAGRPAKVISAVR